MSNTNDHADFELLTSALQDEIRAIRHEFPVGDADPIGRRLAIRSLFSALDAYLPIYGKWMGLKLRKDASLKGKVDCILKQGSRSLDHFRQQDKKGKGDQFDRVVKVRNRVTHPKTPSDLIVSRHEYSDAVDAMNWIAKEVDDLLPEGYKVADPHGSQHLQAEVVSIRLYAETRAKLDQFRALLRDIGFEAFGNDSYELLVHRPDQLAIRAVLELDDLALCSENN